MSPKKRRSFRPGRNLIRNIILIGAGLMVVFGAWLGFIFFSVSSMADVEMTPNESTIVYGDDGKIVAELYATENRTPVKLEDIPKSVRDAFIAIEDNQFYTHHGVSLRSVVRSVVRTASGNVQGGSTITMQLAKVALTGSEHSFTRKIKQTFVALQLERRYTKDEILEMYLNWVFFGHGAYGVQAAAHIFFGKDIQQVTLPEAAMLAGTVNLPGVYSPYLHFDKAKERQELVLDQMVKYNKISAEQAAAAKKAELKIRSSGVKRYPGGYFVDYILQQLLDKYGADRVYGGGLRVYTTVNIDMQNALEKAMTDVLDPIYPIGDDSKPHVESAGVFIDPHTGYIKALAGGRKYDKRLGLNRAVASYRQPGSAFKPIAVYTPALDLGMSPGSLVDDSPKSWRLSDGSYWTPKNYDDVFKGLMSLREAVADSRNLPAVKTIEQITPDVGFEYAMKIGRFKKLVESGPRNDKTLSLALGGVTNGVSPLELTAAYGVFANGGVRTEPLSILKVTDKNGNVLEENTSSKSVVISEQTAYLMTNVLQSVVTSGTGRRADLGRPTAGKTGTTTDLVDAWWVGYTTDYVGAVWLGYDEPKRMSGVAGGGSPALIWKATMLAGEKDKPITDFPMPEGISTGILVCKSGELPGPNCPPGDLRTEVFRSDRVPTQTCTLHVVVKVCADHPNRLAGPNCPNTMVRVMTRRPVPYLPVVVNGQNIYPPDWANEAPTQVCEFHGNSSAPPSSPPMP